MNIIEKELIIDNFAGGGGASTGIEEGLLQSVDIAINHDEIAIAMHKENHPNTNHYCESVWNVDPLEAVDGKPVGLCWLSPDCTHFSKAKGGKPVKKEIRGLAWIGLRWASSVRPRVIMLENVEEFQTWGPLKPLRDKKTKRIIKSDGSIALRGEVVLLEEQQLIPDKEKQGRTFKRFISSLKSLGYEVEYKVLRSCDYGAPTTRKRFFLIARCDGNKIRWAEPTHASPGSFDVQLGKKKEYSVARDIIDWDIPTKSIFNRKKPLAEATLKRIARGVDKYVLKNGDPFIMQIMQLGHTGFSADRNASIDEPIRTIVSKNEHCLVVPSIMTNTTRHSVNSINSPISTITTGNHHYLMNTELIKVPFIEKAYGGGYTGSGTSIEEPLHTITSVDHNRLCEVHLKKEKLNVSKEQDVQSFLIKYYGNSSTQTVDEPIHTIVGKDTFGLVNVLGSEYRIVDIQLRMLEPKELAKGQGFPDNYKIQISHNGRQIPKYRQVSCIGNSVTPVIPKILSRLNLPEIYEQNKKERREI